MSLASATILSSTTGEPDARQDFDRHRSEIHPANRLKRHAHHHHLRSYSWQGRFILACCHHSASILAVFWQDYEMVFGLKFLTLPFGAIEIRQHGQACTARNRQWCECRDHQLEHSICEPAAVGRRIKQKRKDWGMTVITVRSMTRFPRHSQPTGGVS